MSKGMTEMERKIMRGEIYYADLDPVIGSEQGGMRPILILQNNVGNMYSPTVVIVPITSRMTKNELPTHVNIGAEALEMNSIALLEQIRTIDKCRLDDYIGKVTTEEMKMIENALLISVGISWRNKNAI